MLDNDFLASLPDDPELAFIELIDRLDRWLNDEGAVNRRGYFLESQYGDIVRAFADEYNLEAPFRAYGRAEFEETHLWWAKFSEDVRYYKSRLQFRHKLGSRMLSTTTITLNTERRIEIHVLLDRIRKVVAVLSIDERKRDAIYGRVAALAKEVDTSKTRFGTLMDLILETSTTVGKSAEELDPLARLINRLSSAVGRQRAEDQQKQLSAPTAPKQIAPPSASDNLDDDIPF